MARTVKCPVCKKQIVYSEKNPYRPFCSERCRLIDLGQWLKEDYRIPDENSHISEEKEE
jgi:hypothetical protein